MLLKKRILVIASLTILITSFWSTGEASHRWNLLERYVQNPEEFRELDIGKKIVYWHQRKIGEALVEKDYMVFQFDKETKNLIDLKGHWRE